ncbi:MAG TPA: hypothetical protein DCZ12_16630 [Gammaproteobacteria bacterium]|nr:hypothetical protein [Gammaproteobacteria bacterium]
MYDKRYPSACPHDPIKPLFEGVYWVHGSIKIAPGIMMNRNMVILKQDNALSLINPVRLNDAEEQRLLGLGDVKNIIRLGDFHGRDDAYYVDTFKASFWCQTGQTTYPDLQPDHIIDEQTVPPIDHASFFVFASARYPEAALLLKDHRVLITTDSIQYHADWTYTTFLSKIILGIMGFRKSLLIGGPWLKRVTPKGDSMKSDFERLMALDFDRLIGAHGAFLQGGAKTALQRVIAETF